MKRSTITIAILIGSLNNATAQQLELSSGNGPAGSGPLAAPASCSFKLNTGTVLTFSAFTPSTTFQISFSNQQHVSDSFPGMVVGGTTAGANATTPAASVVYQAMNSLGSPANTDYTSGPFITAGTGFSAADNYGYRLFSDVSYLQGQPLNGRYYYGDMTLTFSRPVMNPVIHLSGIGAQTFTGVAGNNNLGYYTEFDLSAASVSAGLTLTKLSGTTYFNVTGTSILNSSNTPSAVQPNSYYTSQSTGNSGSGGSVRINTGSIAVTSVTFKVYVQGDGGVGMGNAWMSTTRAGDGYQMSASLGVYTVSGSVFNDVNGLSDNTVNGVAIGLPTLYANLVDAAGNLYASTAVTAGSYSFTNVVGSKYTVVLSTSASATTSSLPSGWMTVGEKLGMGVGNDGASNGNMVIEVGASSSATNVVNANFGIQQPPTAGGGVASNIDNPSVAMQHTVPASTFSNTAASSDPSPGAVTSIRITAFPTGASSIVVNGTTYTNANFPGAGVVVAANASGQPTQTITVDPTTVGVTTVSIPFKAVDAAGFESANTGTAVVNFVDVRLQGTVRNDPNGGAISGSGMGIASSTQLYINLVNAATGLVTAVDTLPSQGTYSFGYIDGLESTKTYNLVLSTTRGVLGTTTGAVASLPTGWVNTAEGDNVSTGDGTPNGLQSVTVGLASINAKDFGIERGPNTDSKSATINNPVTNQYITLNGASSNPPEMTGSDPDDQPAGGSLAGKKVAITSLPVYGKLWYNGTQITVGQNGTTAPTVANPLIISGFNPSLLQFQATGANYTIISFTYAYVDEAGIMDSSPATYSINWSAPLSVVLAGFDARSNGCHAVIQWESASEASLASYELQFGKTGNNDFLTIATVTPKGNGSRYEMSNPQSEGQGYYRLKMIDHLGMVDYSAAQLVTTRCGEVAGIRAYPNPTTGLVHILELSENSQVLIYNFQGQMVAAKTNNENQTSIDLSQLASGTYQIVVKSGHSVSHQLQIVKQ